MKVKINIRGTRPILFHSNQLARPHGQFAVALRAISSKRKKTEADHIEMARIEWRGGWWINEAITPFGEIPPTAKPAIPFEAVESMLAAAGSVIKSGKKLVQASVICVETNFKVGDGLLQTVREMEGVEQYMDQRMARVQAARILRTRPRIERWSADYTIDVNDSMQFGQVETIAGKAGDIGLGDWRPRYGIHIVESVTKV